jgi:hypothetical protein
MKFVNKISLWRLVCIDRNVKMQFESLPVAELFAVGVSSGGRTWDDMTKLK